MYHVKTLKRNDTTLPWNPQEFVKNTNLLQKCVLQQVSIYFVPLSFNGIRNVRT